MQSSKTVGKIRIIRRYLYKTFTDLVELLGINGSWRVDGGGWWCDTKIFLISSQYSNHFADLIIEVLAYLGSVL